MQLLQMTTANRANAAQFAEVVHQDQILAGHVLEVVNSSAYQRRNKITSLKQAVTLLGVSFLSDVAIASSLGRSVFRAPGFDNLIEFMRKHSLASAFLAQDIAKKGRGDFEGIYLCGLMHGIGRPIALKAIYDVSRETGIQISPEEMNEMIEEIHTSFGMVIADQWNLPEAVKSCILHQNDWKKAETSQAEVKVIHLAGQLASHFLDPEQLPPEQLSACTVFNDLVPDERDREDLISSKEKIMEIIGCLPK